MRWRRAGCIAGFGLLQACGGKATDTLEQEPETEEESSAIQLCEASCDHQEQYCDTLDRGGCSDLCRLVVAELSDDEVCLDMVSMMWGCDVQIDWQCSFETNIVGQPINDSMCTVTRAEVERHGCFPTRL